MCDARWLDPAGACAPKPVTELTACPKAHLEETAFRVEGCAISHIRQAGKKGENALGKERRNKDGKIKSNAQVGELSWTMTCWRPGWRKKAIGK